MNAFESKFYNGKFFHDMCWFPIELCRGINHILTNAFARALERARVLPRQHRHQ